MIGRSKMNESLPDMTSNGMLLVHCHRKEKRQKQEIANKFVILHW